MPDPERQLSPEVVERLVKRPPSRPGETVGGLRFTRGIDSGNSRVWICHPESEPGAGIVVKQFNRTTKTTGQPSAAEREFRILRSLEEQLRRLPTLHVPHAILYLGDHGAIVTREVTGDRADSFLVQRFRRFPLSVRASAFREAERLCVTIGEWLRGFHAVDRLDLTDLGERVLEQRLTERYEAAERRIPERGLSLQEHLPVIRAYFTRSIPRCGNAPTVLHHPDLSPQNMIRAPDGLYVLDLSEVGYGHPLEDAAFFWAYLETLKLSPLTDRRRVTRCQTAFLYAATGEADLPPFWQRWGMFMRLSYLTRSREQAGKLRGMQLLRRNMVRRNLKDWLISQPWERE